MLSFRYIVRLLGAFIVRFRLVILLAAIAGVLMFFFIRVISPHLLTKNSERIGVTGRYRVDTLPTSILSLIGDGLTKLDESGLAMPNLASSWETPDKGQTWMFHLAGNKYWQDGKKVTSAGITYRFSDAKIERPDTNTIVFKLDSPFAPFPVVVNQPTFKKGLLGTGEWKVTKADLAGSYVQSLELVNAEKAKKIYKFYPTEERTKLAYKLGQVDKIEEIYNPEPFDRWSTAQVSKNVSRSRFVAVFFNTQDNVLSDKSIRQALDYAIDKGKLGDARALGPISPDSWAYNPQVKQYNYDPQRARELLKDLSKEAKANLKIKLATIPVLLPVAEKIAKYWEEIGVPTTVQVSSGVPGEFQALLAIFDIPSDPDQYAVWHSTQLNTNISRYKNARIDKLLEDGRLELNLVERRKIYLDFQRFLVEDSPAAFLYHPTTFTITKKQR